MRIVIEELADQNPAGFINVPDFLAYHFGYDKAKVREIMANIKKTSKDGQKPYNL
jgi:hypothetical protein